MSLHNYRLKFLLLHLGLIAVAGCASNPEPVETYALFDPDFVNGVDPWLLLAAIVEIKRISDQKEAQSKQLRGLYRDLKNMQRQTLAFRGSSRDI